MDITFRPLPNWPFPPTKARGASRFKSTYGKTLLLLDAELRHLRAKEVVIQAGFHERDIRLDGLPRSDARNPIHPGVILTFQSKHGPISFPCDTYSSWEDNLRAIALSLENLRAVDRYGVTKRAEQYRGWQALPAPGDVMPYSRDEAIEVVLRLSGFATIDTPEACEAAYKKAALKVHPDRNNGKDTEFKKLQAAMQILRRG